MPQSEAMPATPETSAMPSVDALDDSNLATPPEAAARACPECGALMKLDTDSEGSPGMGCTECAHFETFEAAGSMSAEITPEMAAQFAKTKHMRCETCGLELVIEPLASGHGFKVIAGAEPGQTFGVSPNGFPLCPKDDVALLPVGPTPIGEAVAAITDAQQPVQPRLPHTTPPFNVEAAFKAIVERNREVEEAREVYEAAKKAAKEAKDALDDAEALLGKLIDEFDRRRREGEAAERGTLRPEQDSVCYTERMTGQPCHICREARRKAKEDESADDGDLRVTSLQEHLARRGVHLDALDIQALGDDNAEIEALEAFAHGQLEPLPAFLVARSCVAGPVGEDDAQRCTVCGVLLHNKTDEDETAATPYPEGDRVGLDCAGDPGAPAADGDEPEPARQLPKRHKSTKDTAAAKSKAAKAERQAKPKRQKRARA